MRMMRKIPGKLTSQRILFHRHRATWRHKGSRSGFAHKRVDSWRERVKHRLYTYRKIDRKIGKVIKERIREVLKSQNKYEVRITYDDASVQNLNVVASNYDGALRHALTRARAVPLSVRMSELSR